MIVKIKVGNKYHIVDNVSNVGYYSEAQTSSIEEKLKKDNSIILKIQEEKPTKYNWITYTDSNGISQSIIFDAVAYICNDSGKTIEIVRV